MPVGKLAPFLLPIAGMILLNASKPGQQSLKRLLTIVALGAVLAGATAQAEMEIQPLDSIRDAAEAFVLGQVREHPGTTMVEAGRLDPRLRLQRCEEPLEAFAVAGQRTSGNTSVGIRCASPRPWTIYVPVRVAREQTVVILTRSLQRDARLEPDVMTLVKRDTTSLGFGYFTDLAEVEGLTLRRAAAAGTVLSPTLVAIPPTIRRGEQVTLIAQRAGIAIRAPGRAMADARAGETLRVRNLSSDRVVEGVVRGPGEVEVHSP